MALGWVVARLFLRQGGMRCELVWSVISCVTALTLAQMLIFAIAGGGRHGGKALMPPVLLVPALVAACCGAVLALRLRRGRKSGARPAPETPAAKQ